jgi:hypothetical protein
MAGRYRRPSQPVYAWKKALAAALAPVNERILIVEPAGAVEMLVSIMGLTPLPLISRASVRR